MLINQPEAREGEQSTNETTPQSNEKLENKLGGWTTGVETSVLLQEAGGGVIEAGVGLVQTSLQSGLVYQEYHHRHQQV